MIQVRKSNSRSVMFQIVVAIMSLVLALPGICQTSAKHWTSPFVEAQKFLLAIYPDLAGKQYLMDAETYASLEVDWVSVPPFEIQIGPAARGHMDLIPDAKGTVHRVERKPVLTASFQFDRENTLESASVRSAELTLYPKSDRMRSMVDAHQNWSDEQISSALKRAGAKFGPDEREALLEVIPLKALEPFIGTFHVDSAEFRLRHQQKPESLAELYWVVLGHSEMADGRQIRWQLLFEPFDGKLTRVDSDREDRTP